jgi:hypothetical protein
MSAKTKAVTLLIAFALAASCGGGGDNGARNNPGRGDKNAACPEKLPLETTKLPAGFSSNLVKGVAPGKSEIKNVRAWHYSGPEAKVIEVFRGGQRHKFTKGKPIRSAGTIARTGKIEGGYAAKLRLGRGRCSRYVYEGIGLNESEIKDVAAGLKRSGAADED